MKGGILASIADEKVGESERQPLMKPSKAKDSTPSPHLAHQETNQTSAGPPLGSASLRLQMNTAWELRGGAHADQRQGSRSPPGRLGQDKNGKQAR